LSKISIAKQVPFNVLIKRIIKRILPQKKHDYTKTDVRNNQIGIKLNSLITVSELKEVLESKDLHYYLIHEFNLLGSGWVNRNLDGTLIQNESHQKKTDELLKLISNDYKLINWQKDVKSNFEFDVSKQYNKQEIGLSKNVDIKNCWELGRLQHLPQIAFTATTSENSRSFILEMKNQILDFIASNPVGMGVLWGCAMDVGIRVSNMLIAYDVLTSMDNDLFDKEFENIFSNSVYQHGKFIFNHLEHKEGAAGNHYLFNLLGLLFVANYLNANDEIEIWRKLAEEELVKEFDQQFFADGGNFEGSTTYHCLSVEAMIYSTALMLRNDQNINQNYINTLFKAGLFIKDMLKPNGEVVQFGDNDSGRLFKFNNEDEQLLNYQSLLASFSGLFKGEFDEFGDQYSNQKNIVEQLAANNKLEVKNNRISIPNVQLPVLKHKYSETTEIRFLSIVNVGEIKRYSYSEFGLYIFKSNAFYLAVSAISNKKMHHSWGHVHNDKLSFELQVDGFDLVKDPGTYTYSAFPELRNEFRSTKAHHSIVVQGVPEQNKFNLSVDSLTYMDREVVCEILEFMPDKITLKASYYGAEHVRRFEILTDKIIITDYCNKPFTANINKYKKYSPKYGVIQAI
jgi:hypothetical protein